MRHRSFVALGVVATVSISVASLVATPGAVASESAKFPVYTVERVGLSTDELRSFRESLGSMLGQGEFMRRADGSVVLFNPSSMQAGVKFVAPPSSSAPASGDDEKLTPANAAVWDVAYLKSAKIVPPARAEAILKAATARINLGDVPAGAAATQTELEIYDPATRAVRFTGSTGTTVGRLSTLSGLPVTGPGQSIDLFLGADGKVAYANINVRRVKASPKVVAVPVGSAAAQACATAGGSVKGAVYSGSPTYYMHASLARRDALYPVLSCSVTGIADIVSQEFYVDVRDIDRPVGIDLGRPSFEQIPGDEGTVEFGSAYLGDNANAPLNNACADTDGDGAPDCPRGWAPQDNSQINTDAFDRSMSNWGRQVIASPDNVAPALFVGGPGAQANAVDLMWYTGHASARGWQANTGATPTSATTVNVNQVSLGQADLEWLMIAACGPLQNADASGVSWRDRLSPMFQGLHQLLSYATISATSSIEGQRFADYARGAVMPADLGATPDGWARYQDRFPTLWAWMFASIDAQPVEVAARPAVAATATTPARAARPAIPIQGAAMGTEDSSGGTMVDCLNCGQRDQYPSLGASVWRLAWGT